MPDSISITGSPGSVVPAQLNAQLNGTQISGRPPKSQAVADVGVGGNTSQVQDQGKTARRVDNLPTGQDGAIRPDDGKGKALTPDKSSLTLDEAVETVKEYIDNLPSEFEFKFDKDADRLVFKIVNPVTREVVKQYPPEELLTLAKRMKQMASSSADNGFLIDDKF